MQTENLREVSLLELREEADAQETLYARGGTSDDAAGLELFRRAMVDDDAAAWQAVMEVYRPLLVAHAGRRVVRGLVIEDNGFCVDRAFQRFWQACRNGRLHQFDDLAAILTYLKMCLGSVLLDEARSRRRQACTSLDDVPPEACISLDPAALVVSRLAARQTWDAINAELRGPRERLVARLSFVGGLTPREILVRHPDTFRDVNDVYRTKRNVVERLRHSSTVRDLLT
jgi:DNA-directed RNA polymerase specialized sigma24 family protein